MRFVALWLFFTTEGAEKAQRDTEFYISYLLGSVMPNLFRHPHTAGERYAKRTCMS